MEENNYGKIILKEDKNEEHFNFTIHSIESNYLDIQNIYDIKQNSIFQHIIDENFLEDAENQNITSNIINESDKNKYLIINDNIDNKGRLDNNKKQKKINQIEIPKESSYNPTFENTPKYPSPPKNSQDKNYNHNNNIFINNNWNIEKSNNNNINEQISEKNELKSFNYYTYKDEYQTNYINYPFKEPPFINLEHILDDSKNKPMIKNLGKIGILIKKENLQKINEGIIFKNLSNFLEDNEDSIVEQYNYNSIIIRRFMPDEMSTKIKTFLLKQIIDHINSFEEMKGRQILVPKAELINKKIKADFNYIYMEQNIYSIISNEPKNVENNYKIVRELLQKNNKKEKKSKLLEYLNLEVKDYLDIIRYKSKKNNITSKIKKLDSFLISEKKKFRNIPKREKEVKDLNYFIKLCEKKYGYGEKEILEDYICSLLLLTFNLERFFYLRISRGFKQETKNN